MQINAAVGLSSFEHDIKHQSIYKRKKSTFSPETWDENFPLAIQYIREIFVTKVCPCHYMFLCEYG